MWSWILACAEPDAGEDLAAQPAWLTLGPTQVCESPGPLGYTDVAAEWGLTGFASDNPDHINGGGAAVVDFDLDGDLDVLLAYADSPLKLMRWANGGFLGEILNMRRLQDTGTVLPVDLDGDGDFEVIVGGATAGITALASEDGKLAEDPSLLPADTPYEGMQGPAAADPDADGDVDLYLPIYTILMGDRTDVLLRRDGGEFVIEALPPSAGSKTYQGLWFDADDDGDMDAYATNDQGATAGGNALFLNDGGALTPTPSVCAPEVAGMSVDSADINGDGLADLYLGNSSAANLFYADGEGGFYDAAQAAGAQNVVEEGDHDMVWGVGLFDAENDGDIDIFAAHGDLYSDHDPASGYYDGADTLLLQEEDGTFTDVAGELGLDSLDSGRAVVPADFNQDGVLDLLVTGAVTEPHLWRSDSCTADSWLELSLVGTTDNRHGLGAKVEVEAGGVRHTAWVTSSASLFSGRAPTVHVGLGTASTVTRLTVTWPSGAQQSTAEPFLTNRTLVITQI